MAPGQVWGLLLAGLSLWPGLAGARAPVPAAPPEVPGPLGPAEQEQSHYLAQLFGLYGENGTLTVGGLARLLHSLGLGRVQGLRLEHRGALEGRPGPLPEGNTTQRPLEPGLSLDVWSGLPTGPSLWGAREEPGGPSSPRGPPSPNLDLFHRLLLLDHSLADHLHEDCLNGSQLLVNFGLSPAAPLTPGQFALLCPALLYQIDSRVCIRPTLPPAPSGDLLAALAHSSLAVLLLSVPTPLSLLLLRLVGGQRLRPLLGFLGSLAVGTLCGDALLHLLPHAQGGRHSGSGSAGELGPGLALLGGLFLLFLLENLLGLLRPKCHRRRRRDLGVQDPEDPSGAALQTLEPASEGQGEPSGPSPQASGTRGHLGHGHSHGAGGAGPNMTWMVLLGDALHNLTDGLAIGAAFSDGLPSGVSTTLAVFCHELPHELGDFAILLQAGLPLRRLVLLSVGSGALGLLGAAMGVGLSRGPEPLTPWVFAVTAGVFLYVALVDMLPALLRPREPLPAGHVLLQGLGLLLGGGLMLTIALLEDRMLPLGPEA
ncbi:zinc transporter ZIP5 isoform X2 [Ornithorhynchus anatinus]|uniref:zinc transporter ZIP5 isoform X2 n=1 Tax=Ornithorhynchus anatinus TaxID=9258 RepID=UPI0010A7A7CA|nr:zinc transporter ZIP5 isoform X2 [Ornithorhynchus anatinus]